MKTLLLFAIHSVLICLAAQASESLSPQLSDKFGEVFNVTIEFIEKPNTYYAQNMVKAQWFAKVKAVNGKALKKPVVMEYRSREGKYKKGSTVTLRAYEDIKSFGVNREWDGVVRQCNYMISHFLRIRTLTKTEQSGAGQPATAQESKSEGKEKLLGNTVFAGDFTLKSPQLQQGKRLHIEQVFSGFGCKGKNISPTLYWEGAPKNTKSFAVTVYDPDAPTGSGWWHWIIFNIPANINKLPKNAGDLKSGLAPKKSVQSKTDFGTLGYGGAAPPPGDKPHHYQFTVYALDIEKLPLDINASGAMVGFYLNQHVLAKSTITVYYSR